MPKFLTKLLEKLFEGFKSPEQYKCSNCDVQTSVISLPDNCPACGASADKLSKIPHNVHPVRKW